LTSSPKTIKLNLQLIEEEVIIPSAIKTVQEYLPQSVDAPSDANSYGLSELEIKFVRAVKNADFEDIKNISDKIGVMPDAVAEKINEAFADGFGDVIIEGENPNFNIIEDYEDDIAEWLLKLTK